MANAQNSSSPNKVRVTATLEGAHADIFNARLTAAGSGRSAAWLATQLLQQALAEPVETPAPAVQGTTAQAEPVPTEPVSAASATRVPTPRPEPEQPTAPRLRRWSRHVLRVVIVLAIVAGGIAAMRTLHIVHTQADEAVAQARTAAVAVQKTGAEAEQIVDILAKNRLEITQLRARVEQLEKQGKN